MKSSSPSSLNSSQSTELVLTGDFGWRILSQSRSNTEVFKNLRMPRHTVGLSNNVAIVCVWVGVFIYVIKDQYTTRRHFYLFPTIAAPVLVPFVP